MNYEDIVNINFHIVCKLVGKYKHIFSIDKMKTSKIKLIEFMINLRDSHKQCLDHDHHSCTRQTNEGLGIGDIDMEYIQLYNKWISDDPDKVKEPILAKL